MVDNTSSSVSGRRKTKCLNEKRNKKMENQNFKNPYNCETGCLTGIKYETNINIWERKWLRMIVKKGKMR